MVWWECRFDTPGTEGNDVDIFPYREAVRKTVIFSKNNSYKGGYTLTDQTDLFS